MVYHTESKPQGWRALAIFGDGTERLIYLGRSTTQVRAGYARAFAELLDEEEREQVCEVSLQRWNGAPDAGVWESQTTLAVPSSPELADIA